MNVREEMVALARAFEGANADEPERYLDLVAPHETQRIREYMLNPKTYGCALVVRGLWRLLGVQHPILTGPYRVGMAVSDVVDIARSKGAWVDARPGRLPGRGDSVLVGTSPEHVFTCLDVRGADDGTAELESIDGGQLVRGAQTVVQRERVWSVRNGSWIDHAVDNAVRGRAVIGWADVEKLVSKP